MPARSNLRRIKVEFGDCDPAQIAYYPNLVTWIDHSTHHLFESAGFPARDLLVGRGIQVPVVGLNVRFLTPAIWGDEIDIESHIA
jgi:4-hydroxybenzoyl-CoA thioesterase